MSSRVIYDSDTAGVVFPAAFIDTGVLTYTKKHLRVVRKIRSNDGSSDWAWEGMDINGDTTGANYVQTIHYGNTAFHGVAAGGERGIAQMPAGLTAVPTRFSTPETKIPFAASDHQKVIHTYNDYTQDSAHGVQHISCIWANTAPVTRLKFWPSAGSYVAGSRVVVYEED
jgi:hypothetical protein